MAGLKVAIVGTGRLGQLMASRIPANCRKVVISRKKARAVALADEIGGIASDQLSAVRGCQVILLAVPGSVVQQVVQEIQPHVTSEQLVVNMAPELLTHELAAEYPAVRFAAAKIIGDVDEMAAGSPGVVVLDRVDGADAEHLQQVMSGLGWVVLEEESRVLAIHQAIVDVMNEAGAALHDRLSALGLASSLIPSVIAAAAPGVLRALTQGEKGGAAKAIDALHPGGTTASPIS